MNKTLLLLAAAAAAAFALTRSAAASVPVKQTRRTGKSGIVWIERWDPQAPQTFLVWAPAGAFGPHEDMPVARLNLQTNVAEAWPGAPEAAYQTVESDFNVKLQR